MAVAFVGSRMVAHLSGVVYQPAVNRSWKLLDVEWLRTDLSGSLWHLHSQPPLNNFLLGAVGKLAPGWEATVFHFAYMALGLLAAIALVVLLHRLGATSGIATAAALLFVLSPDALLHEHNMGADYPVAVALVFSAWAVQRYGTRPTVRDGLLATTLVAVPALIWSLFHLLWVVGVLAVLVVMAPNRRRTLVVAALPLLLVGGWYAKNLIVFNEFGASTWLGMSLHRIATAEVPEEEVDRLIAEDRVSPIAAVPAFQPLGAYSEFVTMPDPRGHPAVDELWRGNIPNYNHVGYIAVSRAHQDAAITIMRTHPQAYGRAVVKGVCRYFRPVAEDADGVLDNNLQAIASYTRLYHGVVYGQLRPPPVPDVPCGIRDIYEFPVLLPVLFAAAVAAATWGTMRADGTPASRMTMAIVLLALLWPTVVGNVVEHGTTNRFRLPTLALMWVALAFFADHLRTKRTKPPMPR